MNLMICCTPLQMLLASRIRKKYPEEKFFLVLLCLNYNSKYDFYFRKVKEDFEKSKVLVLFHNQGNKLFFILSLLYIKIVSFLLPKFNSIFISNIDLLETQIFLSKSSKIFTFDDGTANFSLNSSLFSEYVSLKRKMLNLLFFNRFSAKRIRELTSKHYTIYKEIDNIVENNRLEYIELFPKYMDNTLDKNGKMVSIFVGQVLDIEPSVMEYIFKKYDIAYYYPHPRDSSRIYNIEYLDNNLILEDFILSGLQKNKYYKIYTFFSGAVLNLADAPNLEIYPIYLDNLFNKYDEVYKVFKKFNLDVIHLKL